MDGAFEVQDKLVLILLLCQHQHLGQVLTSSGHSFPVQGKWVDELPYSPFLMFHILRAGP